MSQNNNILYSTTDFDVVEVENEIGIVSKTETVLILPFVNDEQGLPLMLGVLKTKNQFRDGGNSISLICGNCDSEDANYIGIAKEYLKKESGYDVNEADKWYFLGTVTSSNFLDKEYPCFAVDVSEMERNSEGESSFIFIPANDVVKSKDVFIPALFLKLFKFVVGMDLYNREDSVFSSEKGLDVEI
jgi:hypothetical protein